MKKVLQYSSIFRRRRRMIFKNNNTVQYYSTTTVNEINLLKEKLLKYDNSFTKENEKEFLQTYNNL